MNGKVIQNEKLKDSFNNAGLNIACPARFIVLQGKISKYVMMRPKEFLWAV